MTEAKLQKKIDLRKPFTITINDNKYRVTKKDLDTLIKKIDYKKSKPTYKGGIIPLIPIFAALSAIGALSGGAAGIAKAVTDTNKNTADIAETKRHNKVIEGKGLYYLDKVQGKGITDFLKNILKQSDLENQSKVVLKNVLKNLTDGIKIEADGKGLYFYPKNG